MNTVMFFGGPRDGQTEILADYYAVDGKMHVPQGWPLTIEVRSYVGVRPTDSAAPEGQTHAEGRRIARYRFTQRVSPEGYQVYEHVPD